MTLTNKIKQDATFTMILGVGTAWGSTIYLIRWITTVLSASYETNNIINYAKNFGKFGLTAVAILFLDSILKSICKGMKPFETVNVKRMKAIAWLLILSVPAGVVLGIIAGFMDPTFSGNITIFSTANTEMSFVNGTDIIMLIVGDTVGIISEIFDYGNKIENDLDMIA